MSYNTPFTKDNLNSHLKELAKEFRKRNGTSMPAEIILIGGAAILANYGFREMTYDIDAIIFASSAMKEAINHVGDKLNLPNGWLNTDFVKTKSYSSKISEVSVYYKTFYNVLTVRTIAAEYLIAMKLMSGRQYKNDLSDIVAILWEHKRLGMPITKDTVINALNFLYGEDTELPAVIEQFIEDIFKIGNYEKIYNEIRESEKHSREILLDFDRDYPNVLKESNTDEIIKRAKNNKSERS